MISREREKEREREKDQSGNLADKRRINLGIWPTKVVTTCSRFQVLFKFVAQKDDFAAIAARKPASRV